MEVAAVRPLSLIAALALLPASSLAASSAVTEAQKAQIEELRGQVAAQIQLQAYDLLDELVLGWIQQPVFPQPTPVVLADVSVPVGFGSGLQALVENHFISLVVKNPRTKLSLSHCPQCQALVVHSGAKGTIVSRGVDAPEALASAGALSGSRHALFLDFEIEGAALVLRARLTSLEPALPIVYSKTLSTSTSAPAMLRLPEHLKSAEEARQEYLDALQGRGTLTVPVRIGIRTYAAPSSYSAPTSYGAPSSSGTAVRAAPFYWLQTGLELSLTQARAWTGSLIAGFSWAPELHTAWMAQVRFARLLTGSASSLTHPDLYLFLGGALVNIHGKSALPFSEQLPTVGELKTLLTGTGQPEATFPTFHLGLELRMKNRLALALFFESLPTLDSATGLGRYFELGIGIHSIGAEVSFCF
jgi:hypothetical protein